MTKKKNIALIIAWSAALILGVVVVGTAALTLRMDTKPYVIDQEADDVGRTEEMSWYDPTIKRQTVDAEWPLAGGIEYSWEFSRVLGGDLDRTAPIGDELKVDRRTNVKLKLSVKNTTEKPLTGLRLFYLAPFAKDGRESVVADEATFLAQLRNGKETTNVPLDIVGDGTPFKLSFLSGNIAYWYKDGEVSELAEPYHWFHSQLKAQHDKGRIDYDAIVAEYADFWRNEGMKMAVPAGETWNFETIFQVEPVYDLRLASTVATPNGEPGKGLVLAAKDKNVQTVHIESDFANSDKKLDSVTVQAIIYGDAEIVPGSVELNGKPAKDFTLERKKDDEQRFEPVELTLKDLDGMAKLSYDVRVKANKEKKPVFCLMTALDANGDFLARTTNWATALTAVPWWEIAASWVALIVGAIIVLLSIGCVITLVKMLRTSKESDEI